MLAAQRRRSRVPGVLAIAMALALSEFATAPIVAKTSSSTSGPFSAHVVEHDVIQSGDATFGDASFRHSTEPATGLHQQAAESGLSLPQHLPDLTSRDNLGPAIQMLLLLTVLSLAPALLVLCTSFTRIIIVLSLLRQALGTQNLPPNQVLAGLSLFMTCIVMAPTWTRINEKALQPYLSGEMSQQQALAEGVVPLRHFMIAQIDASENSDTALMFLEYSRQPIPEGRVTWGDISTATLIPAFVLSELKVAFLMGFKIYLPFLVIDLVISIILTSMGMLMLPPVLVSLPFKLLLFVLVDGWTLVAAGLMGSFVIASG